MNRVIENIKKRRSVRKYKPGQVSEAELASILEAGQFAPSGGNCQTTHLIVIQNEDILKALKHLVEQAFSKMDIYDGMYKSLQASIRASKKGGYDFTYNAPTLVLVANKIGYGNALVDSACVLENMMLAAVSLNVGSCWINQLHWLDENTEIRAYLQQLSLEEDETICGGLALGYGYDDVPAPLMRTGNRITYIT